MKKILFILIVIFTITSSLSAETSVNEDRLKIENGLYFTGLAGFSHSFSDKLKIHRANGEEYEFNADYDTNSFSDSPYWSFRFEKWTNNKAFGLELIHHKLYLRNPQESLSFLDVSDGFNLLTLNKAWALKEKEIFRTGIGVVITHPHVKFQDSELFHRNAGLGNKGYFISGPTVQFAYEKWVYETKRNFVTLETKLTLSYVQFPVEQQRSSYARMTNVAIHFLFGLGSKPMPKNPTVKDRLYYFAPGLFPKFSDYIFAPGLKRLTRI